MSTETAPGIEIYTSVVREVRLPIPEDKGRATDSMHILYGTVRGHIDELTGLRASPDDHVFVNISDLQGNFNLLTRRVNEEVYANASASGCLTTLMMLGPTHSALSDPGTQVNRQLNIPGAQERINTSLADINFRIEELNNMFDIPNWNEETQVKFATKLNFDKELCYLLNEISSNLVDLAATFGYKLLKP